jgi:hypothetical protein
MSQWVVTAYGLECQQYGYDIPAKQLWSCGEPHYGWVEHMSQKRWVNMSDFIRALREARQRHTPEKFAAHERLVSSTMDVA